MPGRPTGGRELCSGASVDSCSMEADIPSGTFYGGEENSKLKGKIRCGESCEPRTENFRNCAVEKNLLKDRVTPKGIAE